MRNAGMFVEIDPLNPDRGGIGYHLLGRATIKLRDQYGFVWDHFVARFNAGTRSVWRTSRGDLILFIHCFPQGRRWFARRNYAWKPHTYNHNTPFQCPIGLPNYLKLPKPQSHNDIWSGVLIPDDGPGAHVTKYFDNPNTGVYMGQATTPHEVDLWMLNDAYPGDPPIRGGTVAAKVLPQTPPDVPPINQPPAIWEVPTALAPTQEWGYAQYGPQQYGWAEPPADPPGDDDAEHREELVPPPPPARID